LLRICLYSALAREIEKGMYAVRQHRTRMQANTEKSKTYLVSAKLDITGSSMEI